MISADQLLIERVYEPSRIRRGRASTVPTYYVHTVDGRWSFARKKDAKAFIERGGACADHVDFLCPHCRGRRELRR
jgi:hypothetical protein